jgi:hypothetical protein
MELPMYTAAEMKTMFKKVFTVPQSEILSRVIDDAYSSLVKTSDFNELKEIVKELADAQKRTEIKVEELADTQKQTNKELRELAQAQKQTEKELKELVVSHKKLAEDHKETRRQLGGITQSIGYGLEDKIIPLMPEFVKYHYGIDARIVERKNLIYPDGRFDEMNIYVEGIKDGKKIFVIGECKAQPGKKDADKFHALGERVKAVLAGQIFFFISGYSFDPAIESYIRENYPHIEMFKSYEFELKYKKG